MTYLQLIPDELFSLNYLLATFYPYGVWPCSSLPHRTVSKMKKIMPPMGRHWEECPLSWCFRIVSGLWKTVFCDYSCWNAAVWYYISVFKHILKALDELYFVHWRNQLLWSEYLCLRQVHWLQSQPRCDGGGSGSLSEMIRAWARSRR